MDIEITEKVEEKLSKYKERIRKLKSIERELKEEKKTQVCLTDPDAKSMRNNGGFEPCYNVQTAVDSKHKLIVTYDVVNDANDQAQLKNMVNRAKDELAKTDGSMDESYAYKSFGTKAIVETDSEGNAFIIIGLDSGFEGKTEVYLDNILVKLYRISRVK